MFIEIWQGTHPPTILGHIYNGKSGEDANTWTLHCYLDIQLPNELLVILSGDWNLPHTLWEDGASNSPGARMLVERMEQDDNPYRLLNDHNKIMYRSHDGKLTSVWI
jgi:hypothetical protein